MAQEPLSWRKGARRRIASPIAGVCLLITATLGATGCDIVSKDWHWTLGTTHGAIIETTAGRASLGIYRVPSKDLYLLYDGGGLKVMQDVLWNYGKPPELKKTFTFEGKSVTISFGFGTAALRQAAHNIVYDHDSDLADAVRNAHHDANCLAITLISYGKPTVNWTNKSVGCKAGSV